MEFSSAIPGDVQESMTLLHNITNNTIMPEKAKGPEHAMKKIGEFIYAQSRILNGGKPLCDSCVAAIRDGTYPELPVRPAAGMPSNPILRCDPAPSNAGVLPQSGKNKDSE